jgi:hypothetical protein
MCARILITLIPLIILFSCQDRSQLSETQCEEIEEGVKGMATQLFTDLDANKLDEAMNHIDSLAVFHYISLFGLQISREEIAAAYKGVISLKYQLKYTDVEPLTTQLAYFQGSFHQSMTDSLEKVQEMRGSMSAIVTLQDKNWRFLKG